MQVETLDPGAFRTELSLQEAAATSDGMGGQSVAWVEVATVFARLEPVTARRVFAADQSAETVTHRITMRARPEVVSGMRFVAFAREFEILTVHDPDETGRYLVCATRVKGR